MYEARSRRSDNGKLPLMPWIDMLPSQPLIDHLDENYPYWRSASGTTVNTAKLLGVNSGSVTRWRRGAPISAFMADRIAQRLKKHPAEIWGEHWWRPYVEREQAS